jgi:RNA polymerase sigma factor (TIGR02999 family)
VTRGRESGPEVTELLRRAREGDAGALDRVFPLVLEELRAVAGARLRGEAPGHTLQPTALVNEAYLKLAASPEVDWRDRAHFLAVAARAMRQVLVDRARRRKADKRGGGVRPATLTDGSLLASGQGPTAEELLALDAALDALGRIQPRLRQVVELRYFGGLADAEIGEVLGVTRRTVQRDWTKARAWLHAELGGSGERA